MATTPAPATEKKHISFSAAWQDRLLPLVVRMLVGLTLFFFLASFGQLFYLHSRIEAAPQVNVDELLAKMNIVPVQAKDDSIEKQRLRASVILESNLIARRYHQANVFLMSRVWTNYLGFVTGMTLALVGAAFVLGQIKAPNTEVEATIKATQASLKSASPGITLAILGVALMMTTIIVNHEIVTRDIPTYLGKAGISGGTDKPDDGLSPTPSSTPNR